MTRRQAVVVSSEHSHSGPSAIETVPRLLLERGVEVAGTYLEPNAKALIKRVKREMKQGARLIVVCGGDGTLTRSVPLFAKKNCVLGVVPAGTGNSFALSLGIANSFEAAADAIAYGEEACVDLGTIDGEYFANFLTIGFPSQVAGETPRGLKRALGALAYGVAGIVPILTHSPFRVTFKWKKHRVSVETHQAIVANGRDFGHQPLAKDASLVDGRITVFVRDTKSNIDLMQTYFALLRGSQRSLSDAHLWSTSDTIKIKTQPRVAVAVDGSLRGKTPIRVGVAPKALRVLVPSVAGLSA